MPHQPHRPGRPADHTRRHAYCVFTPGPRTQDDPDLLDFGDKGERHGAMLTLNSGHGALRVSTQHILTECRMGKLEAARIIKLDTSNNARKTCHEGLGRSSWKGRKFPRLAAALRREAPQHMLTRFSTRCSALSALYQVNRAKVCLTNLNLIG